MEFDSMKEMLFSSGKLEFDNMEINPQEVTLVGAAAAIAILTFNEPHRINIEAVVG